MQRQGPDEHSECPLLVLTPVLSSPAWSSVQFWPALEQLEQHNRVIWTRKPLCECRSSWLTMPVSCTAPSSMQTLLTRVLISLMLLLCRSKYQSRPSAQIVPGFLEWTRRVRKRPHCDWARFVRCAGIPVSLLLTPAAHPTAHALQLTLTNSSSSTETRSLPCTSVPSLHLQVRITDSRLALQKAA